MERNLAAELSQGILSPLSDRFRSVALQNMHTQMGAFRRQRDLEGDKPVEDRARQALEAADAAGTLDEFVTRLQAHSTRNTQPDLQRFFQRLALGDDRADLSEGGQHAAQAEAEAAAEEAGPQFMSEEEILKKLATGIPDEVLRAARNVVKAQFDRKSRPSKSMTSLKQPDGAREMATVEGHAFIQVDMIAEDPTPLMVTEEELP